ncbi:hemicentin-1-like [Mytilus californianus]|uniref:hemicentin-1-like n=1 Tax=Mytilus californianus TaxID=6549 RepID=UPI002245FC49|nr:hemicentin-1-like [Mytilus californianus]
MNYVSIIIITVSICIELAGGFFARSSRDGNWKTKSHLDITATGTVRAISKYINANKGVGSIEDFFSYDPNGQQRMMQKVHALRTAVADTQRNKKDTAYIHCQADQIFLAHNFVKSCKQKLIARKDDLDEFIIHLGECLYTIQSFYSNTNWVEMYGGVAYEDFGINDLMDVAALEEDTCLDNADYNSQCKNNIKVNGKLTSGYHQGRGSTKPAKAIGSSTGKCSHGGPDDDSRKLVARCGINKDSITPEWSPHSHLHKQAYTAAVQATENFLVANGTGVLYIIGPELFEDVFHVKRRRNMTLAIAIDYTASMTDDIAAVKTKVIELLTDTVGSANEPADYVLSLFHDPETLNSADTYIDGYAMINKVQTLKTVRSNDRDCPEYAGSGTLAAIELMRDNSPLYVFTDADAKDANRLQEVCNAAKAKNIPVSSLLTNQCSRRKRSSLGRDERSASSLSFYQQIANATGGTVYETDKENIGNVLDTVIGETFPSSEIIIDSHDWLAGETGDQNVTVDSTITVLKISVTGSSAETDVDIYYTNGTLETYTSGMSTRIYTSSGKTIISIQHPPGSIMKLRRNVISDWKVNITAQSAINVDGEILEQSDTGEMFSLKGNPISDNNYTVSLVVYNLGPNGTCHNIALTDSTGNVISSHEASQLQRDFDTLCAATFRTPYAEFQFKLYGNDDSGRSFTRKLSELHKHSSVELQITASKDDVIIGKERLIGYEVLNRGAVTETYNVIISDDHSFVQGTTAVEHTLLPGDGANGTFAVKPTTPSVIFSYTISVAIISTGEVQQSITRKLVVTDVERPDCTVVHTDGICGISSLNTANCSVYNWTASAEVTFSGTLLESISSTVGMSVKLAHVNITGLSTGPIAVNISGDCCTPSVYINVIDVDGFISQCDLSFGNGQSVQSVEDVSEPSGSSGTDVYTIIILLTVCVIQLL